MKHLLLFVFFHFCAAPIFAQPGALDNSFGNNGKVVTENISGRLNAVAIQPDGKILVAGAVADTVLTIVRYLANGNIDSSFANNGFFKLYHTEYYYQGAAIGLAVLPDGKILFCGYYLGTIFDPTFLILGRLDSTGVPDKNFESLGVVKASYENFFPTAIALQKDFKIVIATYNSGQLRLQRFLARGNIDRDFGNNGKTESYLVAGGATGMIIAIQTDGKIVGAYSENSDIGLVRYKENGTLDSTFGKNGGLLKDMSGAEDKTSSVLLQPDQKIIVAGTFNVGINANFGVARFKTNGTLDSSFGNNGKTAVDFSGAEDRVYAAALHLDGKIITAGQINDRFAIARYKANGIVDSSFGIHGRVFTEFSNDYESANALAVQADGKIVAAGIYYSNSKYNYALARYHDGFSVTNIKSGLWSDPLTWSNNIVPDEATTVELVFDVTVDINAKCKSLKTNNHLVTVNQNMELAVAGVAKW